MIIGIFIIALVILVGGGAALFIYLKNKKSTTKITIPQNTISLRPDAWVLEFSPNMPSNPALDTQGGAWHFDFPNKDGVHMVVVPYGQSVIHKTINMTFKIISTNPVYVSSDTPLPNIPAQMRLYFQQQGDTMSGLGQFEFYRWWSSPLSYALGSKDNQVVTLTTTIDPSIWSSVLGKMGTANVSAFNDAWKNVANVGFTFGGIFAAHGVFISSGTARFTLINFNIT